MAAPGGFSFTNPTGGQQPATGFSFTTQAAAKPAGTTGGFSFGNTTQTTSGTAGGFSFGNGSQPATASTGGFSLGVGTGGYGLGGTTQPSTSTTGGFSLGGGASGGFGLGGTAGAATSTGFSLGDTAQAGTGTTGGFSLGGTSNAATTGGFSLANTNLAATSASGLGGTTGFSLSKTTAPTLTLGAQPTTGATGFSLGGAQTSTAAQGFTLGATPAYTGASTLGGGFGLAKPAATTQSTLGALLGASSTITPASSQSTLGGLLAASSALVPASSLGTGIFAASTVSSSSGLAGFNTSSTSKPNVGLGGVDPKASTAGTTNGNSGKPSDNKALKETSLPEPIAQTVGNFRTFVRQENEVRESIARLSSKPLYRVQEDAAALSQLLAQVSTGLQSNTAAISKLKERTAQELENAQIAQRTKDTPPGLQYENQAPTEYFQGLSERFEAQMVLYRQQIEEMESHLTSLQHGGQLSPQELSQLLNNLHEGFVALAAQLQVVHEAVKSQKDQYLNYRKVFLGDSSDIFAKRLRAEEKTGGRVSVGPTPFSGINNVTALAMASAVARAQNPAVPKMPTGTGLFGAPAAAAPALCGFGAAAPAAGTGLFGGGASTTGGLFGAKPTGFGTAVTTQNTGFAFSTPTATVRPLGSLGAGTTGTGTGFGGFGMATPQPVAGQTGFGFGQSDFQLQNPPAGSKRAKKP